MKWSGMKIVLMAMLVAGILSGFGRQGRSQNSSAVDSDHHKSDSLALMTLDEIDQFVAFNYGRLAIDTMGPEPEISIIVETNGDFSQLDSIGLNTGGQGGSRSGDYVHLWVPIRLLSTIRNLESVIGFRFDVRVKYQDIRYERKMDSGMGIIEGIIESIQACIDHDSIILIPCGTLDNTNTEVTLNSLNCTNSARIRPSGAFRIAYIMEGCYTAVIIFDDVNGDMQSDPQYSPSCPGTIIIDSIYVKQGFFSLITDQNILLKSEGGRYQYHVWREYYREIAE